MKVFLDANLLVSVLNKELPLFHFSARILSLSINPKIQLFTSPICLAIAYYFAEKKSGTNRAKKKIAKLNQHIKVTNVGIETVEKCLKNPKIMDFEDGLEYYSALSSNCTYIVTQGIGDFHFSEITVLSTEAFLTTYLSKKRDKTYLFLLI